MRAGMIAVSSVSLVLMISTVSTSATVIDIRDCPLDTVTFVDPWADGTFVVRRVGTLYSYLCEDGAVDEGEENDACSGPFGGLFLEGLLTKYGGNEAKKAYAIYFTMKAAPCCGWEISEDIEEPERIRWREGNDVPRLRDVSFLSIDPTEASPLFGNPKFAASCTLR